MAILEPSGQAVMVEIDGETYQATPDSTVLEVAREQNIFLPTLCDFQGLEPTAACRLCLVETDDGELVSACTYPVSDGLSVRTSTDRLESHRRNTIQLLLADNCPDCLTCEARGDCELATLAYEYDVELPMGDGESRFSPLADNPFFRLDHDKCILCGRCVRSCDAVRNQSIIEFMGRGMETRVGTAFDRSLTDTDCKFCGQCVDACPTGALEATERLGAGRATDLETTSTICTYCGVGCRLELRTNDNQVVDASTVSDPSTAPANGNRLCTKGRFGFDFINDEERVEEPLIREDGEFHAATWEEALEYVADRLATISNEHGQDAIAGLASATCTNEENYLFQKVMRAALGTNNIDHCARLCHASTVTGLGAAFGSGAMTNSIDEIRDADTILVTGSNTTEAHPVIGLEVQQAVENGANLIVVDPRDIELADVADIHLRQPSGTDVAWINGVINIIHEEGWWDEAFVEDRTEGFEEMIEAAADYPPERVEELTGIDPADLREAAELYATADRGSILYAMGITQHTSGTDNVLALANLAMVTGNVGRESTGVNPLRGQNNVQGACDLGALPDVYPGYQSVADPEIRASFESHWQADLPDSPGLTVVEMMDAASEGSIRGMYVMGENPMVSDPHLRHVEEGLENLEFLVVQDLFVSETAELADVVLPAASFAEKSGTFTNTERRIQSLTKAIEPIGNARPDWEILQDLSTALGFPMAYDDVEEITAEIATVTPIYGGITPDRIDNQGLQWPCTDADDPGTEYLHADEFACGKGQFNPVRYTDPNEIPDDEYPFRLTTGRMLYHHHTRTMTGRARPLDEHVPEAYVELNPQDGEDLEIEDGEMVHIASRRGEIHIQAKVTDMVPQGTVFIPFHFAEAAANRLTNPALDPAAKIPELKVCAVSVEPLE